MDAPLIIFCSSICQKFKINLLSLLQKIVQVSDRSTVRVKDRPVLVVSCHVSVWWLPSLAQLLSRLKTQDLKLVINNKLQTVHPPPPPTYPALLCIHNTASILCTIMKHCCSLYTCQWCNLLLQVDLGLFTIR